jgi:hypothetical protein
VGASAAASMTAAVGATSPPLLHGRRDLRSRRLPKFPCTAEAAAGLSHLRPRQHWRLLPPRAPGKGPMDVRDAQAKARDIRRPQGRRRRLRSAMVQGIRFVPTLILTPRVQVSDSVSYCDMPFQSSKFGCHKSDLPNATRAGLLCWPGKECLCRHANPRSRAIAIGSSPASAPGLEFEGRRMLVAASSSRGWTMRWLG